MSPSVETPSPLKVAQTEPPPTTQPPTTTTTTTTQAPTPKAPPKFGCSNCIIPEREVSKVTPKFDMTTPIPKAPETNIDKRFGTQGSDAPTGSGPSANSGTSDDSNVISNESAAEEGEGGQSNQPTQPSQTQGEQQGPSQASAPAGPTSSSPENVANRFSSNESPSVPSAEQMKQMLGELLYKFNYTVGYHGHRYDIKVDIKSSC